MNQTSIEKTVIHITNVLFVLGTAVFILSIYMLPLEKPDKTGWKICISVGLFLYLCLYIKFTNLENPHSIQMGNLSISSLALIGEDRTILKEWNIYGKVGLLIGKSVGENQVDIDLSFTSDAPFISGQHALLNYCDGHWYIEDAGSKNGLEIKKASRVYKLTESKPLRLERGDIIRINETALLLR